MSYIKYGNTIELSTSFGLCVSSFFYFLLALYHYKSNGKPIGICDKWYQLKEQFRSSKVCD